MSPKLTIQPPLLSLLNSNGGVAAYEGVNYPYRGAKGSYMQGGIHNLAFIMAPNHIIPYHRRGGEYNGLVHISGVCLFKHVRGGASVCGYVFFFFFYAMIMFACSSVSLSSFVQSTVKVLHIPF
jgi:hypothetical protein